MNGPVLLVFTAVPLCALARSGLETGGNDPSQTKPHDRRLVPFLLPLFASFLILFALTGFSQAAGLPSSELLVPLSPTISACDPITVNSTWSAGIYTATNCHVIVPAGVTLTLNPGVIIKFSGISPGYGSGQGSTGLLVYGSLIAGGSLADPVVFTSLADDEHGEDTGQDGQTSGAAGQWYGLVFKPGSVGQLENFFVGYAGSGVFSAGYGYNRAQIDVSSADVQLRNGTITAGLRKGIYLEGAGLEPILANLHIADNNDPAWNSPGYAVYQTDINMQPAYSGLIFSGNDRDEVIIGRFNEAMTQNVVLGGINFGFVCGYSLCQLTVPNSTTLTIAPGTLLDFRPSYGIAVASGGSLIAEGTPTQPITFTSQLAAAADGASQHWMGLWAKQGSTLRLDHCDISYADDTNFGLGGLEINTDDAVVNNCAIHHNRQNGLYIYARDGATIHPTLENVAVTDNGRYGVYLQASSGSVTSVTWDGGRISDNGWSGVTAYTWNSVINPTLRNLTIAGNGGAGDYAGRYDGLYWNAHNVNPILENLTITGNVGTAIHWLCNGSITARDLSATGNGSNELILPGCPVGGGRQWDLGDAGIQTKVTGSIEIGANALLSIQPGTTLAFDKNVYGSPTGIQVNSQAALYALGTVDKPIIFTGATQTPGWWAGIVGFYDRASVVLRHCDVSYAGGSYNANLRFYGNSSVSPSPVTIENCDIHHSSGKGIYFDWVWTQQPTVKYNSLHDNAEEGITNWNAPALDARNNWWGDASGPYHATQNPSGQGESVGDNILFYPWLGAPDTGQTAPGQMLVTTGSPTLVSPGETVDYAVQYLNGMTETVRNGLLVVQLPAAAEYVTSSGGGIYWPERDQVFWKLGDLAPGSQDFLMVQLHFAWGLPRNYSDSSITLFTADNYNPGEFDTQPYLAYAPGAVNAVNLLSRPQLDAELAASPALQSAYNAAVAAGYTYHSAANVARTEGETVLEAVLVDSPRRAARILGKEGDQVLVYTVNPGEVIIEDGTGGMRIDLTTGEKREWGDWAPASPLARASSADGCTADACKRNCRWSILGWEYIKKKAGRMIAWTALAPFTGGGSVAGAVWEIGSTAKKLYDCDLDCRANPSEYCCTAGQVRWSGGGLFGGLTNSCFKEKCNAAVGLWVPDSPKTCIAFGQRCVAGIGGPGCVDCEERGVVQQVGVQTIGLAPAVVAPTDAEGCSATAAGSKPRCRDLNLRVAKDPNAIAGLDGDLLPSQVVTYTITYENEGAGRAYGVYVVNPLPAVFNAGTLTFIHKTGVYLPASREIMWLVGELGPKGAADSTGAITYTVALTGGLASGTVVANQAVVYFSSVPEETPTNTWVNLVSPLVATPQALTTDYMAPLAVTLSGREVSDRSLSFEIVEQPHGGTLTGTPPNVTYTPAANFTGPDSFSFTVDNGTSTSRAAQVRIEVSSAGDTTPPTVLWTIPAADAAGVAVSTTPVFTDTIGPLYSPTILIGVSEALSETTVTTVTVSLAKGGGPVAVHVAFDGGSNQIVLRPRVALAEGEYTVTVGTAVTDVAGNGLAAPYLLRFRVGEENEQRIYLPSVQK